MELKTMLAFCAVLGLALLGVPLVSGECCFATDLSVTGGDIRYCDDCKKPDNMYCGTRDGGGCNIFGCNCGGGCIPSKGVDCLSLKKRRSAEDSVNGTDTAQLLGLNGREVVTMADKDGDGMLNGPEAKLFLEQRGIQPGPNEWLELDVNRDGKLAAHEIDHDLAEKNVAARKMAISFWP